METENNRFLHLFLYDLKRGMRQNRIKYAAIAVFVMACCLILYRICGIKADKGTIAGIPGFGDYLLFLVQGSPEFKADSKNIFNIPPMWMFLQFMASFLVYSYAVNDLDKQGMFTLIKSESRTKWWLSKCIWNVITVLLMYGIIWLAIWIISFFFGNTDVYPSTDICREVFSIPSIRNLWQFSIVLFLSPLVMNLGICLAQMALSMVIGPVFSFAVILIVNILSAYFLNPVLIGNYTIMMRSDYIIDNGVNFPVGAVISVCLMIISIIGGGLYFKKCDILNKG